MSNKLKAITTKAKQLYKSGKYAKWTDAIKEASKSLAKTTVKKTKSGLKSLAKKVYESKHLSGVKKKTAKKKTAKKKIAKKSPVRNYGSHKDTKSHNVRISVVSGFDKIIGSLKRSYIAVFHLSNGTAENEIFTATSLKDAKRFANFYKRRQGIKGRVTVHLIKKDI